MGTSVNVFDSVQGTVRGFVVQEFPVKGKDKQLLHAFLPPEGLPDRVTVAVPKSATIAELRALAKAFEAFANAVETVCAPPDANIPVQALLKSGFQVMVYDHSPGVHYLKKIKAGDMPTFAKTLVDNVRFEADDVIAVEVCPDGTVQWVSQNPNTDDHEHQIPINSKKEQELLRDAGFKV